MFFGSLAHANVPPHCRDVLLYIVLTFRRVGLEVGVLLVGAGSHRYRGQARDLDASGGRHDLLGQFYAQLAARRLLAVIVAATAARNAARLAIGARVSLVLAAVKWSGRVAIV